MTTIITLQVNGVPIMVGDLSLSVEGHNQKYNDFTSPLFSSPNKINKTQSDITFAGLRQKLNLINNKVCLAWSGELFHATVFLNHIKSYVTDTMKEENYSIISDKIKLFDFKNYNGFHYVLYIKFPGGIGCYSNINSFEYEGLDKIFLSGSGSTHFMNNIDQILSGQPSNPQSEYAKRLFQMMAYVGIASAQQLFSGHGLKEGWGGGFEIIAFDGNSFYKYDNILTTIWSIGKEEGLIKLTLHDTFIHQFYEKEILFFDINGGEGNEENNILMSIRPLGHPDFDFTPMKKNIIPSACIALIKNNIVENSFTGCFIDYEKEGSRITLDRETRPGEIYIKISDTYIDDIIKTIGLDIKIIDLWGFRKYI